VKPRQRIPSRIDLINAIDEAETFGDIGRGMSASLYTLAVNLQSLTFFPAGRWKPTATCEEHNDR
jgi:hypothetical protein